jgi:hypothetical protein
MFKIVILAHFFVYLQLIRLKFEKLLSRWYVRHIELLLYSKNDIYGFFTEKALHQNIEIAVFDTFDPIVAPLDNNRKNYIVAPRH